jgi:hypothetical protein
MLKTFANVYEQSCVKRFVGNGPKAYRLVSGRCGRRERKFPDRRDKPMEMTSLTQKRYGYIIQALAETSADKKRSGDVHNALKVLETAKKVLAIKDWANFAKADNGLDEEQLFLIAEALEHRAERREIFGPTYDARMMRETAALVREFKRQREAEWMKQRFQEGIA